MVLGNFKGRAKVRHDRVVQDLAVYVAIMGLPQVITGPTLQGGRHNLDLLVGVFLSGGW